MFSVYTFECGREFKYGTYSTMSEALKIHDRLLACGMLPIIR